MSIYLDVYSASSPCHASGGHAYDTGAVVYILRVSEAVAKLIPIVIFVKGDHPCPIYICSQNAATTLNYLLCAVVQGRCNRIH